MKIKRTVLTSPLLLVLVTLLFFHINSSLWSAELTVPHLEMASFGSVEDDEFNVSSVARADIAMEGGYKYGALLRLSFISADLEKALANSRVKLDYYASDDLIIDRLNNQASLGFSLAKVIARNLFSLPLEFSYFIGMDDVFCSGEEFPTRFGTVPIGSSFQGFSYFPMGINGDPAVQYDGIHRAIGTGLSLVLTPWETFVPMFYLYQDASILNTSDYTVEKGKYSADFRFLTNLNNVKIEAFLGTTRPSGRYGSYRGGLLAFFTTGVGADFLAQVGIPAWQADKRFTVDNLFFLFEPRLNFGPAAIHITLFYHPLIYMNQENPNEKGATDVNIKLLIGDMYKTRMEGGLETTMGIRSESDETFMVRISPFMGVVTDGVRWDLKVRVDPMGYKKPYEMFETYIGVRTAY